MVAKNVMKVTRIMEVTGRKRPPTLTLFRMGFFETAHGRGKAKICHTYPAVMKLGIVIPYTKKIQDTPLEFC